jgi:replicative DNA helicase
MKNHQENINIDHLDMKTLFSKVRMQVMVTHSHEDGICYGAVPSGFNALDRLTNGFCKSTLTVIAGRPAMGKTGFALSMAKNIAVKNKPVAYFSLEMSDIELGMRLVASEMGVNVHKLKKGGLEHHEIGQLQKKTDALEKLPLFIDDTASLNMIVLREKCCLLKQMHNIQIVIVDYLQLIEGGAESRGNRVLQITDIMRQLKALAKELEIPVVVTCQLSRAVEIRGNSKKPQLSDLRESGAIEQDADIVALIYRPEHYGITEDENGNSTAGIADIIVEKHRNGPIGTARLKFNKEFARFENLEITC